MEWLSFQIHFLWYSVHYFTIHQCEKMPLDCNDLLNVLMTLYSEGHCNANLPCKVFPKFTNNRIYDYPSNRVLKNSVVISLEWKCIWIKYLPPMWAIFCIAILKRPLREKSWLIIFMLWESGQSWNERIYLPWPFLCNKLEFS